MPRKKRKLLSQYSGILISKWKWYIPLIVNEEGNIGNNTFSVMKQKKQKTKVLFAQWEEGYAVEVSFSISSEGNVRAVSFKYHYIEEKRIRDIDRKFFIRNMGKGFLKNKEIHHKDWNRKGGPWCFLLSKEDHTKLHINYGDN